MDFRFAFSGSRTAAAADVLGRYLRRVCHKDDGALEDVSQFADVAGPGMLLKGVESTW